MARGRAREVAGYCAGRPLHGWSSHVGEVRLIVDPATAAEGVGRLPRAPGELEAFHSDLKQVVVEVLATQDDTIGMFRSLGFDPEALLDGPGPRPQRRAADLMILAHTAADASAAIAAAGLVESDIY